MANKSDRNTTKPEHIMKLETLLTPGELHDFNTLVAQATTHGAQAVRWHSTLSHVLVLGICADGELLTWFASPAYSEAEAELVQTIVLQGLSQSGAVMALAQKNACDLAADAIQKAATRQ